MATTTINKPSELATAFMRPSFPVNPKPFINGLLQGIDDAGTMDWIKTDEAKAILHILNSMAYGQLYTIDACDEYTRLKKALQG
jgi:hypothetical protein